MTKKKAVFNRNIAHQLCELGFRVVETQPNSTKPWLIVYYFEATPQLAQAFDAILRNKK